jgi:hypothetical protein
MTQRSAQILWKRLCARTLIDINALEFKEVFVVAVILGTAQAGPHVV